MVANRLGRMIRYVQAWRPDSPDSPLDVSPDLSDSDQRRLARNIDQAIDARGGEVAARRKAELVAHTVEGLSPTGRRRFNELLATHYDTDFDEVRARARDLLEHDHDRHEAEANLRAALNPPRLRLLRRLAGMGGGPSFLVKLREDLIGYRSESPELRSLDRDLKALLETWFDVSLLTLERITWESPAALLERLIAYEAVHAIESWDDLKGRLGAARRLYGFLHPAMPDDPLIFVEVALTDGVADSLPVLLDHSSERIDPGKADTAIFYSISNCHRGLAGVSLGDLLIKSVVELIMEELPNIQQFATLSPLPGFRHWLQTTDIASQLGGAEDTVLDETEAEKLNQMAETVRALVADPLPSEADERLVTAKPTLTRLAAQYLTQQRPDGRVIDPVAHFHLSNGASIDRLNWWANPSETGWDRGLSLMVNYRYDRRRIERNHDHYASGAGPITSDTIARLVSRPAKM